MQFFLKRFFYRLVRTRFWFLSGVAPALIYLAVSAGRPDHFVIYQDISISPEAPLALSTSPTGFLKVSETVARPGDFLLNRFALKNLALQLGLPEFLSPAGTKALPLVQRVKQEMTLSLPLQGTVRIQYSGGKAEQGRAMVDFYSQRLIMKNREGLQRLGRPAPGQEISAPAERIGLPSTQACRVLFRIGRIVPTAYLVFFTFLFLLLAAALVELADPSFKSVRQAGRYLGLPTLGALPDLDRISKDLGNSR